MTFSADGHFFACGDYTEEIYLWKDSPTGYTLHRKFELSIGFHRLILSPDGRSILAFGRSTLQLRRTTDLTPTISIVPPLVFDYPGHFVLGFSPDESLTVAARLMDGTATVLDLSSGIPRLTIDAGMGIYGLRVGGGTVVAVGHGKIITWNLPQMDCDLNATANISDSIQTTVFDCWPIEMAYAAISSDFSCIAVGGWISAVGELALTPGRLKIYNMTTGKYLAGVQPMVDIVWFKPDRLEVLCYRFEEEVKGWALIGDSESNSLEMESLDPAQCRKSGYPWTPPSGCGIADDGWVFGRSRRRLLWLPPHWRSHEMNRMWSGRFLALLHYELLEPVILEVLE